MGKIRLLIIEDNRLLREGISSILKKQPDMTVGSTHGNGEKLRPKYDLTNLMSFFLTLVYDLKTAWKS